MRIAGLRCAAALAAFALTYPIWNTISTADLIARENGCRLVTSRELRAIAGGQLCDDIGAQKHSGVCLGAGVIPCVQLPGCPDPAGGCTNGCTGFLQEEMRGPKDRTGFPRSAPCDTGNGLQSTYDTFHCYYSWFWDSCKCGNNWISIGNPCIQGSYYEVLSCDSGR